MAIGCADVTSIVSRFVSTLYSREYKTRKQKKQEIPDSDPRSEADCEVSTSMIRVISVKISVSLKNRRITSRRITPECFVPLEFRHPVIINNSQDIFAGYIPLAICDEILIS